MNYAKHYDLLIEKHGSKNKPKTGYYERHHIVPKCLGGNDLKQNLVYLSFKAHLLAHWLLHKSNPKNMKLSHAFFMLCFMKNENQTGRSRPPFHVLEIARKNKNDLKSKQLKGFSIEFNSPEATAKSAKTRAINGSHRGLNNGRSLAVDVYDYYSGKLVAINVSCKEWGRENNVERNLDKTLHADRSSPSTNKNRHHAKGYYIVLAGSQPYEAVGGNYPGPGKNYGHVGLKKVRKK